MPLLHKKPFRRAEKPPDLKYDTKVFYLEATNEIFLRHEDYFNRVIELNSTVWSCAYTRKTNLTFFEALESEKEAHDSLSHFPDFLEKPIIFIVKNFTNRGRFEDLVNDCYNIMKERFFIGEEVTFTEKSRKYPAKIIGNYVLFDEAKANRYEDLRDAKGEPREPLLPTGELYRYTIQLLEGPHLMENGGDDEDDGIREHVPIEKLFRSKHIGSRQKVKLFLKNACYMPWPGDHYIVKDEYLIDGIVNSLEWDMLLAGDPPVCPQTPVLQRGRTPNVMKPGYVEPVKKVRRKKQEKEVVVTDVKEEVQENLEVKQEEYFDEDMKPDLEILKSNPAKKSRKKKSAPAPVAVEDIKTEEGEPLETPKKKRKISDGKKKTPKISEKKKKQIREQQEQLEPFFKDAEKYSIDLTEFKQDLVLLDEAIVEKFKESVKEAKEKEKEAQKEERRKKNRERTIYMRKREDLICDDLKPLPRFPTLELPKWINSDDFNEYLFVMQFFCTFQELLPLKEIRGTTDIYLSDIIIAIRCNDPQNSPYADLLRVILSSRADVADEEDGDEADLSNRDEIALLNAQNCDPGHSIYGEQIRESTELHYKIRKIHGKPVRHLPVDWMTLSEILRLVFMTSGYYSGLSTHRHRLYTRGNYKGYEDPCFEFRQNHPEIIEKLRSKTVFDLEPNERLEIMKALILQLLTYSKYRNYIDEQHNQIYEYRKEQKKLKLWDQTQEQEANQARIAIEQNTNENKNAKISQIGKRLKTHIKGLNEGRRVDREDLDTILLESVPYSELDLDEIVTARSLQKDEYAELMKELVSKIFEIHSMISDIIIGKDRAFRKYFIVDNLAAILIETPNPKLDHIGNCDEPSIVEKPELLIENETQEVFICSGNMETCKIHGKETKKWSYINGPEQFEKLMKTLNPRGFRENDLIEEFNQFKPNLIEILETTKNSIENGEWIEGLMTNSEDPAESWNIDWNQELRDLLLDFEEKIEQGQMGSITKTFGIDRIIWRENLKNLGDTMMLLKEDIMIGNEIVVSIEDLSKFDEIKKLCIAFFQIVKCISTKFIQQPFVNQHKDENGIPKPSEMFIRWQKSLIECESLSSLSLFLSTIEVQIQWGKSRLQGKCKKCRRKGATNELILCSECDNCYHLTCVNLENAEENEKESWKCVNCNANKRKLVNEEKRKKNTSSQIVVSAIERENGEDEMPMLLNETESDSKLISDTENSMSDMEITRTLSGRAVRKVQYNDMVKVATTRPKRSGLKNFSHKNFDSNDEYTSQTEEDETEQDSSEIITEEEKEEIDRRRSKRTPKRKNFEKLDQVKRQLPQNIREKMLKIENLLKESMREEFSWPFIEAVDRKEVPDYYDVIKRPMNLRAMMNKLKQRIYNEPIEIRNDFFLIIDNCETYNETESEIYRLSRQLFDFLNPRLDAIIDS
ncbi:unnamed protein product [Caenorhabditis angaria]|uniref:Uncharacterized protein n=1 Tax=Caenorhabditis angaria TaxID=860376 RepID=A0A9P1ID44_9PELO|nr:unnamed protein product [Caenorhabditis angaria]